MRAHSSSSSSGPTEIYCTGSSVVCGYTLVGHVYSLRKLPALTCISYITIMAYTRRETCIKYCQMSSMSHTQHPRPQTQHARLLVSSPADLICCCDDVLQQQEHQCILVLSCTRSQCSCATPPVDSLDSWYVRRVQALGPHARRWQHRTRASSATHAHRVGSPLMVTWPYIFCD